MNKRDKIKLIITGFLVLILILTLVNAKQTVRRVQERRKKTLKSTVLTKQEGTSIPYDVLYPQDNARQPREGLYRRLEEESKNITLKRDPFIKYQVKTKSIDGRIELSGIIWNGEDPKAVINNKIVGVGDQVGRKTVIEITPNTVILSDGPSHFKLRLGR